MFHIHCILLKLLHFIFFSASLCMTFFSWVLPQLSVQMFSLSWCSSSFPLISSLPPPVPHRKCVCLLWCDALWSDIYVPMFQFICCHQGHWIPDDQSSRIPWNFCMLLDMPSCHISKNSHLHSQWHLSFRIHRKYLARRSSSLNRKFT